MPEQTPTVGQTYTQKMRIYLPSTTNLPTLRNPAVDEGVEEQLQHAQTNQDQLPVNPIVNLHTRSRTSVAIPHLRYAEWAKSPKPTAAYHESSDIAHCDLDRGLISHTLCSSDSREVIYKPPLFHSIVKEVISPLPEADAVQPPRWHYHTI